MSSTLGQYYVRLKDQSGTVVAIFDSWQRLEYSNIVNGVGSYQFVIDGSDDRVTMFELDGQIEVWRRVPGMDVAWYLDFEGLHRKQERQMTKEGVKLFVSSGVTYNDMLARTVIGYKEGTIRAEKSAPAETVMKEFVIENCTSQADDFSVVGRLNYDEHYNDETGAIVYYAALPGFAVEADSGGGDTWEGIRAYENLLSTLQDIANETGIDFNVVGTGDATFEFRTYLSGIGADRRNEAVNPQTGKNAAGNSPVVFSVLSGAVEQITYTYDRLQEINAFMILGEGDLSLREVYTQADTDSISASPWNRREATRPGSNQETIEEYNQVGRESLKDSAAREMMEFDPLQTQSHCYGVDYRCGDIVTAVYDEIQLHKKLTKVTVSVSGPDENITIEFADIR